MWVGWCDKGQINPIQPSTAKVVDFRSELFQEGLPCSTLNSYRSAISSTIPQVEGCPVGQHPLVCKFMKGIFNSHPPQPKYSGTWVVGLVTKYLEGLPSDSDLTVSVLTKNTQCFKPFRFPSDILTFGLLTSDLRNVSRKSFVSVGSFDQD